MATITEDKSSKHHKPHADRPPLTRTGKFAGKDDTDGGREINRLASEYMMAKSKAGYGGNQVASWGELLRKGLRKLSAQEADQLRDDYNRVGPERAVDEVLRPRVEQELKDNEPAPELARRRKAMDYVRARETEGLLIQRKKPTIIT